MLVHGVEEIQELIKYYQNAVRKGVEPEEIHGVLWKSDRRTSRFFRTQKGTPLLLYGRNVLASFISTPPSAAVDLTKVKNISFIVNSNKFVLQGIEGEGISEVELIASTSEEAQLWVKRLNEIKNYFSVTTKISMKEVKSSKKEMSEVGKKIFLKALSSQFDSSIFQTARFEIEEPDAILERTEEGMDLAIERFRNNPKSNFPETMWTTPGLANIPLRGWNYLNDHKKNPAERSLMKCIAVDCYSSPERFDHVASHPSNRVALSLNDPNIPFIWIVVYQVPGSPTKNLCFYFTPHFEFSRIFDEDFQEDEYEEFQRKNNLPPKFVKMVREFFFGEDDDYRNQKFKMVPFIKDGPFVVRHTVPNKPAIIGKRLPIRYFRNRKYMELDIDIGGGTKVAKNLTELSVGLSTSLVFEVGFVLEGQDTSELPEEVIAAGSVVFPDLKYAEPIN